MTQKRWTALAAGLSALIALVVMGASHWIANEVSTRLVAALGPQTRMGSIHVGFSRVTISDLEIPAPEGWPTPDLLRAREVWIDTDLTGLWSTRALQLSQIQILDAQLSCVRQRNGHVRMLAELPVMHAADASGQPAAAKRPIEIGALSMERLRVEIFDETVRSPPFEVVLDPVTAVLKDIRVPVGDARIGIMVNGRVPSGGAADPADGSFKVTGWLEPGRDNSQLTTQVRGVALVRLQPYLLRATESGVTSGTLDLDLDAQVQGGHLDATGELSLNQLKLAPAGNGLQTFMGLSREAVLKGMEDQQGQIKTRFVLQGNLSDPKFSLNEDLAMRAGSGLAAVLGVSVSTVAETIGQAGQSGVGVAGKIVQGAGVVVKRLFGN